MKILLADSDPLSRRGLRLLLEAERSISIVEASREADVPRLAREEGATLVILELLPDPAKGCALIREIRDSLGLPVLVVTAAPTTELFLDALRAGATGFVSKAQCPDDYRTAVARTHAGELYLCSCAQKMLVDIHVHDLTAHRETPPLSQDEERVMTEIARGYTNVEIAERLQLSLRSVETIRAALRRKLGAHKRADLVRVALDARLIGSSES